MAIEVLANDPDEPLDAIYSAIDDGAIETWTYDEDGDFTRATPQWQYQAWLEPDTSGQLLRLTIMAPTNGSISVEAYAIYHGRFAENDLCAS